MLDGVTQVPVRGYVGASFTIERPELLEETPDTSYVELPPPDYVEALIVRGNSQNPRFRNGEVILYDARPLTPDKLVGQWAIVEVTDGRQFIKILRGGPDRWRLESVNADPEEDVTIRAVCRYLGLLHPGNGRPEEATLPKRQLRRARG
jgi:phage repressor protein C with HTH and peptisase S24 domain